MATNTPILGLKKPVPNVEENWAFRLNESLDILDQSLLVGNASSTANVTTYNIGTGLLLISGSTNPVFEHVESMTFDSDFVTVGSGTFYDVQSELVTAVSGSFDEVVVNGVPLSLASPVDNSFKMLFHVADRKSNNVDGGTFTSGAWHARTLNSVEHDSMEGLASLSSNTITLDEGTYYIEWRAPAYKTNRHRSILYNLTGGYTQIQGASSYCNSNDNTQTVSIGTGVFQIFEETEFQIWHRAETTRNTTGFGVGANFGIDEIYTEVKIWPYAAYITALDTLVAASGIFNEGLTVSGVPVQAADIVGKSGIEIHHGPTQTVISGSSDAEREPTGFLNTVDSQFEFDENSRGLSLSPTVTGSTYEYWIKGDRYEGSYTQTITISDVDGNHAIYLSPTISGVGELVDDTSISVEEVIRDNAYVALVAWDVETQTATIVGDERHGLAMDWSTHYYLHIAEGARYLDGFAVDDFTLSGDGSSDSDAQLTISGGRIADEDLTHTIVSTNTPSAKFEQSLSPAALPMFTRSGSGEGNWTRIPAGTIPVISGTGNISYNSVSGGVWDVTEAGNNRFVATWVLATNDVRAPVIGLVGQRQDNNLSQALENNTWDTFQFGDFPTPEARLLYRLIFQTGSYGNHANARLREVTDYRGSVSSPVTGLTQDHGSLSGLLDDDHTQYVIGDGSRASIDVAITGSLNIPQYISDPANSTGDIWINTTTSGLRWNVNGTVFEVQGTEV